MTALIRKKRALLHPNTTISTDGTSQILGVRDPVDNKYMSANSKDIHHCYFRKQKWML